MLRRSELEELIKPIAEEFGLKLFDIDLPSAAGGILRITIMKEKAGEPVGVEDCAKVSRKLSAVDRFEDILPPNVVLEVSSPGVNRKLRTPEHFEGAVGEHLKVKAFNAENKKDTLCGVLKSFNGEALELELDKSGEVVALPFADVSEARVDFQF